MIQEHNYASVLALVACKDKSKKLQITNAKQGFLYEIEGLELLQPYKKLLGEDIVPSKILQKQNTPCNRWKSG